MKQILPGIQRLYFFRQRSRPFKCTGMDSKTTTVKEIFQRTKSGFVPDKRNGSSYGFRHHISQLYVYDKKAV